MSEIMNLYQKRVERVYKAINLEQPDRVPISSALGTWSSYYAGYTDSESNWDLDKCSKSLLKVVNDIPMDVLHMFYARPGGMYQALGSKSFHYLNESNIVQYSDENAEVMTSEEYPEFIKDPFRFMVEKVLPRKYSELAKESPAKDLALAKGAMQFGMYGAKKGAAEANLITQYGIPMLFDGLAIMPLDWIADFFRGIKGAFMDMRRRPEELLEAAQALTPLVIRFGMGQMFSTPPKANPKIILLPLHLPTMLKTADFDKFYWPMFKTIIEAFVANGVIPMPFYEGDWSRYYDHLQDLPAKKTLGWFEHGDSKELKQKLGNTMCILGLFPLTLLQYGTKEECITKAKELLDDLAPGGGYIFSTDKELLSAADGKVENIIAVNKFVMEYGIY
ncbi:MULTISPECIES: uroporphyrinogen decarboxylase family protein [unclassified Dehalobacter]|jgi:Uroporphyrinogen-III decarboxylase|uniref:uroporphyrinogen decarboxylase family protein n=1 Tax=unclassified Dehalobacter TaxID=2635733 RepID=UPI00028B8612|nr:MULTISPECIES: uroporphyrinogen decarboxylase family protein [unclassified Dehalobacter]AFV02164.1 Uroporphyrinogen-III decarboxylase [Dehalobacter sp. DCA]AFV05209.1 Uroporphyrinogen-III decarboxylase [Dehalobacter sp. CF]